MTASFQTFINYFGNQIPIKLEISISTGLFNVQTSTNLNPIKQNLTLKIPVIFRKLKTPYSRLKFKISTSAPKHLVSAINLSHLELPILIATYLLANKQDVPSEIPAGVLNFDLTYSTRNNSQKQDLLSLISNPQTLTSPQAPRDTNSRISSPAAFIYLLSQFQIPILSLINHSTIADDLSRDISVLHQRYKSNHIFIFNLYKHASNLDQILDFLQDQNLSQTRICIIGLELAPPKSQARIYQVCKDNCHNFFFFMKPCRCGSFLSNTQRCICHPLVRTKHLDLLSGELLELIHFTISISKSQLNPSQIRTDFFFKSLDDNHEFILELLQNPESLNNIELDTYLVSYLQSMGNQYSLQSNFLAQATMLAQILSFIRKGKSALLGDLLDVFSLQSNYLKYAKSAKFLHYRPFI